MFIKAPSHDWTDEVECVVVEDESVSDIEDEDFSEYMWMENEEEFDQNELQRLEDEECMRQCLEAMLDDELEAEMAAWEIARTEELNASQLSGVSASTNAAIHVVQHSKLNPLAAEFIPRSLRKIDAVPTDSTVKD